MRKKQNTDSQSRLHQSCRDQSRAGRRRHPQGHPWRRGQPPRGPWGPLSAWMTALWDGHGLSARRGAVTDAAAAATTARHPAQAWHWPPRPGTQKSNNKERKKRSRWWWEIQDENYIQHLCENQINDKAQKRNKKGPKLNNNVDKPWRKGEFWGVTWNCPKSGSKILEGRQFQREGAKGSVLQSIELVWVIIRP